ncbi:hypothetical protein ACFL6E_07765, partial [Candidatus Neomarinimicrobiota bacterium]
MESKALLGYDYLIIAGYFAIVLGTAYYFSRRMKLSTDFFSAGGRIPWWLSGISFFMASFSALTFVMYAELSYKYGVIAIVLYQTSVPALILGAFWFSKRWRRARVLTPVQFLEKRYSLFMRQILAWTGIPLRIIDDALKLFSTAIFLHVGMKMSIINIPMALTIIGIILILYSFMGGQWGVIVIDFVQFIILLVSVLLLLPLTIYRIGGIDKIIEQAPTGFFNPASGPYSGMYLLALVFLFAVSLNSTWSLVQKYNCVTDEREAQKVAWFVAILNFVGPIIFFIPAILARILLPEMENARYAYAELAFTVLPTGLMGVLVAGMFSATLSTMGSEFNVLAGILTNDIYKRVFKPNASEKETMYIARVATIAVGVLIILTALLISVLKGYNLFDIMIKAFGALLPATALPILAGLLWRRITTRGALTGLVAGAISGIALIVVNLVLVSKYAGDIEAGTRLGYWLKQGWDAGAIFFNIGVTLLAMYLGSIWGTKNQEEMDRIEEFYADLKRPVYSDDDAAISGARISNFKVIGLMTSLFGLLTLLVGLLLLVFSGNGIAVSLNIGVSAVLL